MVALQCCCQSICGHHKPLLSFFFHLPITAPINLRNDESAEAGMVAFAGQGFGRADGGSAQLEHAIPAKAQGQASSCSVQLPLGHHSHRLRVLRVIVL